jgi:hypothetical protein
MEHTYCRFAAGLLSLSTSARDAMWSAQGVADDVQMFIWKIIVKGVGYYRLYNQSDLHIMTSSMERQIYGRKICIASPLAT